jgi:hypothetical protein
LSPLFDHLNTPYIRGDTGRGEGCTHVGGGPFIIQTGSRGVRVVRGMLKQKKSFKKNKIILVGIKKEVYL